MLSLSSLGCMALAISCPQGLWTTLRTDGRTDGQTDRRTDGQSHTIIRPSNDERIIKKNHTNTTHIHISLVSDVI